MRLWRVRLMFCKHLTSACPATYPSLKKCILQANTSMKPEGRASSSGRQVQEKGEDATCSLENVPSTDQKSKKAEEERDKLKLELSFLKRRMENVKNEYEQEVRDLRSSFLEHFQTYKDNYVELLEFLNCEEGKKKLQNELENLTRSCQDELQQALMEKVSKMKHEVEENEATLARLKKRMGQMKAQVSQRYTAWKEESTLKKELRRLKKVRNNVEKYRTQRQRFLAEKMTDLDKEKMTDLDKEEQAVKEAVWALCRGVAST